MLEKFDDNEDVVIAGAYGSTGEIEYVERDKKFMNDKNEVVMIVSDIMTG